MKLRQGSGKDRGGLVIKRPLKGHKIYPLPRAYIKIGCHHHPPTHPPTTIGHLRVTMGHLRLTVGYLKATVVHLRVNIGHLRVTIGHLRVTIGYFFYKQP